MKKDNKNKINLSKIILYTIGATGILAVALVAPNSLRMLQILGFKKRVRYNRKYYLKSKISTMIDQGLLKLETKGDRKLIRLTEKGKLKLKKYKTLDANLTNKKWDKKWRILTFDIWETQHNKRDSLRRELINFGFKKLQNSVWIYPHECEEFISLLKADFKFGNNARYLLVEKLDNDWQMRKKFNI